MKTRIRHSLPLCLSICGLVLAGGAKTNRKGRFAAVVEKNAALIERRCSPEEIRTMKKKTFPFRPIGVFHSPLTPKTGAPRQGRLAPEITATIEVFPEYAACLKGLESFSHVYVLFIFDRSRKWTASVKPPRAKKSRGLFSTRSPNRPNPIGLTPLRLLKREGRILHVTGVDAFDGTPVVDIKPYVGSIDSFPDAGRVAARELGLDGN